MNSLYSRTSRKPRLTVETLHSIAAEGFAASGDRNPSHCTVRCTCNDILDSYEKDGYTVPHGYSQDRAHKAVLRILRG